MNIEERFEAMKKTGAEVQRSIELFGMMDGKSTMAHLDSRRRSWRL